MDIEHSIKAIPMADPQKFQAELDALAKEGWQRVPGVEPVAIYHLVRETNRQAPAVGGEVKLGINDAGIGILRDGHVHYADGRVEKAQ